MSKAREKIKARNLRLSGYGIYEIAQKLNISKSTVSYWCHDISLNSKQIGRLTEKQVSASYKGRIKAAEEKRKKRLDEIEFLKSQGIKEVGQLSKRELMIAGVGVYWGEGDKSLATAAFTSSSPKLVLFMLRWFQEICKIPKSGFIFRIGLNEAHKYRIKDVEKYWSELTNIPLHQFTKTTLNKTKTKKFYENPKSYYGTLRISIRRSCRIQRKTLGWIEGIAKSGIKNIMAV